MINLFSFLRFWYDTPTGCRNTTITDWKKRKPIRSIIVPGWLANTGPHPLIPPIFRIVMQDNDSKLKTTKIIIIEQTKRGLETCQCQLKETLSTKNFTVLLYWTKLTEIANYNQVLQCHWHNEKRIDSHMQYSCTTTIAFMIDHIYYMYGLTAYSLLNSFKCQWQKLTGYHSINFTSKLKS